MGPFAYRFAVAEASDGKPAQQAKGQPATEKPDCIPHDRCDCLDRRRHAVPAMRARDVGDKVPGHRIRRPIAVGLEEMEIDDPQDGKSLGDIEPDQAFHGGAGFAFYNARVRSPQQSL